MMTTIRRRVEARRFGPKTDKDPSLGQPCAKCGKAFAVGDYTTLVPQKTTNVSQFVAVVEAAELHWTCAVPPADSLINAATIDESHPAFAMVDVYSHGERAGTLVVRKEDAAKVVDRLLCDPPEVKSQKPSTPPPLGDWRSHLRYAVDFPSNSFTPEERKATFQAVDRAGIDDALKLATALCHRYAANLGAGLTVVGAKPNDADARTAIADAQELARRASVAFLAIVAERGRTLS